MRAVIAKEWRLLLRNGQLRVLALALAALLATAAASSVIATRQWQAEAQAAQATDVASFRAQGARNPHSVAHYGQYAFRTISPLAFFDPGVLAATGRGVWMEAHYQNLADLRSIDDGEARRALSPAWLLQLGLPLLIVLAGFGIWAGEREAGTLRLQLVQGADLSALLRGKALALGALAALVWLPAAIAIIVVADDLARAAAMLGAYALYGLIWVALTLAVSAWMAEARSALAVLLALWLATTLLVPRLAVDAAERLHPSPQPVAFRTAIETDQQQGINGHDNEDARTASLLAATLASYGVEREADLPISFAGVALQAGEDYGNAVYDRHYAALWQRYAEQDHTRLWFAALSPLLPLTAVSQAAAGSDWQHHRHFSEAAESHRRRLQAFLNGDFTRHAKGQDFDYRADPALWAAAPVLRYQLPTLPTSGASLAAPLIVLFGWLLVAAAAARAAARRLQAVSR